MVKIFKTRLFVAFTIFVFTASLSTAFAIDHPGYGVEGNIPFAFNAGDIQFPAGNYKIVRSSDVGLSMKITNEDKNVSEFLIAEDMTVTKQEQPAELIFHKIGGKNFLSEIRTSGEVYQLEKSNQEKQLLMDGSKFVNHKVASKQVKE
jgi:hypothetical protein